MKARIKWRPYNMTTENSTFFRSQSDKFILVWVFMFLVIAAFHASHDKSDVDSGLSQFLQQTAAGVVGALLNQMIAKKDKEPGKTDTVTTTIEKTVSPPPLPVGQQQP